MKYVALLARLMGLTLSMGIVSLAPSCSGEEPGVLHFEVTNAAGNLLPCRIHLRNSAGVPQQAESLPFWKDHFVCPGSVSVRLKPDSYTWEIERGPEFRPETGSIEVPPGKKVDLTLELTRRAALEDEGWFSGDLHVHRPVTDIELLMSAEDLDFAPVIEWWNQPSPIGTAVPQTEFRFADGDGERVYCTLAGEDEREGGALMYFGLTRPLDLTVQSREFPSPMEFVQQARRQNPDVWVDVEKPFWWDVPTWLAVARPDSLGIAHNHMHRGGVLGNEAWGRSRDSDRYPGVAGNGLWTQAIYYHMLNSGIRLPPSAGSASGVLPNPVGYNRVYVQLGDADLTRDRWFSALKAGRCFVTNGPLLRVKANGSWSGETLHWDSQRLIELEIELTSNDPLSEVEVIHNGNIVQRIVCSQATTQSLRSTLELEEPGWFLVRAIADVDHTFRFASTAPWYLSGKKGQPHIDRDSVQFFLDWIDQRIERVNQNMPDLGERESVLRWHIEARDFWNERLQSANAARPSSR